MCSRVTVTGAKLFHTHELIFKGREHVTEYFKRIKDHIHSAVARTTSWNIYHYVELLARYKYKLFEKQDNRNNITCDISLSFEFLCATGFTANTPVMSIGNVSRHFI